MTESEKETIQARALLRHHKAKANLGCHRQKLANISTELEAAAKSLRSPDNLRIVNVDHQDRIADGRIEHSYSSLRESVAAFQAYEAAKQELNAAERECISVGVFSS